VYCRAHDSLKLVTLTTICTATRRPRSATRFVSLTGARAVRCNTFQRKTADMTHVMSTSGAAFYDRCSWHQWLVRCSVCCHGYRLLLHHRSSSNATFYIFSAPLSITVLTSNFTFYITHVTSHITRKRWSFNSFNSQAKISS
jgi:hypothetical protein